MDVKTTKARSIEVLLVWIIGDPKILWTASITYVKSIILYDASAWSPV